MGKHGSNTYVIGILLILSINILQTLSRAELCPAAAMGSKAKFTRGEMQTLTCLHSFQTVVKRWNNLLIYWLTGSVQVFNWWCYLLPYKSVTSFIFITWSGSGQGIWKLGPTLLDICKTIAQQIISCTPLKIQTWKTMQHPYPLQLQPCTSIAEGVRCRSLEAA